MPNTKYTDSIEFRCLEHLRETSLDLFLEHCGQENCHPEHLCSRIRNEYIIHFILSGKGTVTAEGQTWMLKKGDMFLIRPGKPLTYVSDYEDPWGYCWIGFNGLQIDYILSSCGFSKHTVVQSYGIEKAVLKHIENILNAHKLTFANDLRRKSELQMLFADLIEDYERRNNIKSSEHIYYGNNVYLEQAMAYIKKSCPQGINVSDIARHIGLSRTYLNQIFQKELGVSVQKFLIDYRLHKAANLLMDDLSVGESASKVGYDDALAFSKAFKKKFGVSPKNFKNRQQPVDVFSVKQPSPRPDKPQAPEEAESILLPIREDPPEQDPA